jgi:hypothetical protein
VSVNHFKGEVWSKVLVGALPTKLVYGGPMVVNRDYEGEIAASGDTVHITSLADPTVSNYTPGTDLVYQDIDDAGQTLIIDQSKSWSVRIDDVDKHQAAGNIQPWMEGRAAYSVAAVADQFIAALYTGVAPANVLGSSASPLTPAVFGSFTSHPADFLVQVLIPLQVILDQASVPEEGRYCIVPPWARGLVTQTAGFVMGLATDGSAPAALQRGFLGSLANFNIMMSRNSVQTVAGGAGTGVWAIQAGHNMAITYADQIVETEALRSEKGFRDLIRGLHVSGAKVIHPEALAIAYVQRPTGI